MKYFYSTEDKKIISEKEIEKEFEEKNLGIKFDTYLKDCIAWKKYTTLTEEIEKRRNFLNTYGRKIIDFGFFTWYQPQINKIKNEVNTLKAY